MKTMGSCGFNRSLPVEPGVIEVYREWRRYRPIPSANGFPSTRERISMHPSSVSFEPGTVHAETEPECARGLMEPSFINRRNLHEHHHQACRGGRGPPRHCRGIRLRLG